MTVVPDIRGLAPPTDPDELWQARPVLTHLHEFARARRASPWAVLGVTLARVTASVPPFVMLPPLVGSEASINFFLGVVGPSGAGKGAAEAAASDAIELQGGTPFQTWKLGSGQGLAHGYAHREKKSKKLIRHADSVLFSAPEVEELVGLTRQLGSTLLPELRSVWMGERIGHLYVDPEKRVPVDPHTYRAALVVGIQPARGHVILDDSAGGTPQRFVWLPATDPDAPDEAPPEPTPMLWRCPRQWPTATMTGRVRLPVCDTAAAAVDEARIARLRGQGGDTLDGHKLLAKLKISAALALLEQRPEVTDDDWQLAQIVQDVSDATRARVVAEITYEGREQNRRRAEAEADREIIKDARVEDAAIKRVCGVILRRLRREDSGGCVTRNELRRAVAGRDRGYFESAMERLEDANQIESDKTSRDESGHGGYGQQYRLTEAAG